MPCNRACSCDFVACPDTRGNAEGTLGNIDPFFAKEGLGGRTTATITAGTLMSGLFLRTNFPAGLVEKSGDRFRGHSPCAALVAL